MTYQNYHWNDYGQTGVCAEGNVWVPGGPDDSDVNDPLRTEITNAYLSLFGRYGEGSGVEGHVIDWMERGAPAQYGTVSEMVRQGGINSGELKKVQDIGRHTGLSTGLCPTSGGGDSGDGGGDSGGGGGEPEPEPVYGCTDPTATNYNPNAEVDDGSCTYSIRPYVKNNGSWNRAKNVYIKDAGSWKLCVAGYIKDGGVWKPFLRNAQAPTPPGGGGGGGDSGDGGGDSGDGGSPTTYSIIPLYRFVNDNTGDHHCRTYNIAGTVAGYRDEGAFCSIFAPWPSPPDTIGIYDVEPGKPGSGLLGHAYPGPNNPIPTVPIYELVTTTGINDTMWSVNPNEGSALGYVNNRVAFYAPTQSITVYQN